MADTLDRESSTERAVGFALGIVGILVTSVGSVAFVHAVDCSGAGCPSEVGRAIYGATALGGYAASWIGLGLALTGIGREDEAARLRALHGQPGRDAALVQEASDLENHATELKIGACVAWAASTTLFAIGASRSTQRGLLLPAFLALPFAITWTVDGFGRGAIADDVRALVAPAVSPNGALGGTLALSGTF
jgi:hypothetical protein